MQPRLIDIGSFIFAGLSFLGSFFIVYSETQKFMGSLTAAILTAALCWVSYVLVRWLILALK